MLVYATTCYELHSFMDAVLGNNQILMHPDDQEKTAFITKKMHLLIQAQAFRIEERLSNLPTTYQHNIYGHARTHYGGLNQ